MPIHFEHMKVTVYTSETHNPLCSFQFNSMLVDCSFLNGFSIDLELKIKAFKMMDQKHRNIRHDIITPFVMVGDKRDCIYFRAYI